MDRYPGSWDFCLTGNISRDGSWSGWVPKRSVKEETLRIAGAGFSIGQMSFLTPTNSVKTLETNWSYVQYF